MDAIPSLADPPFACPPDITLDLPVPPSVNKLRKVDWKNRSAARAWANASDAHVIAARGRSSNPLRLVKLKRFEVFVTLSEHHTKIDLDNSLKCIIDYLVRIELIEDDAPKNLRRLTAQWGLAPMGCRVTVRPCA